MTKPILAVAVAVALATGIASSAAAQDYPSRPIRIVVPFGPGGGSDIVARILGQSMQERLGQPVVIENRPGAGGTLGQRGGRSRRQGRLHDRYHDGRPDHRGGDEQVAALRHLDGVRSGLLIATAGLIIVTRPDFPANNVKELVAAAKADPGKLRSRAPGFGATQHFTAELFRQSADIKMLQVPFRTSPEAISAVLGRQVDVLFDTVSAVLGQVQGGQLKALAVTGKDRFPAVPDVPAAIESGVTPGFDATTWYGFFVPRGTPPGIVAKLNATVNEGLKEEAVRERLTKAGVVVQGSTPEAFGKHLESELKRWNAVREAAGIPQQ